MLLVGGPPRRNVASVPRAARVKAGRLWIEWYFEVPWCEHSSGSTQRHQRALCLKTHLGIGRETTACRKVGLEQKRGASLPQSYDD